MLQDTTIYLVIDVSGFQKECFHQLLTDLNSLLLRLKRATGDKKILELGVDEVMRRIREALEACYL